MVVTVIVCLISLVVITRMHPGGFLISVGNILQSPLHALVSLMISVLICM